MAQISPHPGTSHAQYIKISAFLRLFEYLSGNETFPSEKELLVSDVNDQIKPIVGNVAEKRILFTDSSRDGSLNSGCTKLVNSRAMYPTFL